MRFLSMRAEHRSPRAPAEPAQETLVALTYELLDAHADTSRLARGDASDVEWQTHLVYLRDLQRVGRETLAHAVAAKGVARESHHR